MKVILAELTPFLYNPAMICFSSVTKYYGKGHQRKKVLDEISFIIQNGEFVSVVGPSGAGKTTLINEMIGADRPNEGSILSNDFNIAKATPDELQEYRRKIGVVFQDYKLLPQKTVFENIAFALEVCGYSKYEISRLVTEVMRKTGLEDHRNKYPRQLSGGERQRTAIARALVHSPEMLIADEPTGNLDNENAKQIVDLLLKINQEGTTIIFASHNKEIVDMLRRRVIKLKDGKIVSDKKEAAYSE